MTAAIPERREAPREKDDYSSSYDLNDREFSKKDVQKEQQPGYSI